MKIRITESQYKKILNENTLRIDDFINEIIYHHPHLEEHFDYLKNTIISSGVSEISFQSMKQKIGGLSLHNKVIINELCLYLPDCEMFFIIFHEIAHQYQFKKYGQEKMYSAFKNDSYIMDAIKWLKFTENVADQYGMRKTRELDKMGILKTSPIRKNGSYDDFTNEMFYDYVIKLKKLIGNVENMNPEKVSEILYNWSTNQTEDDLIGKK